MFVINIASFEKVSLQDYPGKISTIVFFKGCQLRCPYCHNPDLVLPERYETMEERTSQFIEYVEKRKNLIEGLVLSGGEPLMEEKLMDFIYRIKKLGLKVKLDTNGMDPISLKALIDEDLLDHIALDYKAPKKSFNRVLGLSIDKLEGQLYNKWVRSLDIIYKSSIEYELRTTLVKELHTKKDLYTMAKDLKVLTESKIPKWFLQAFEKRSHVLNDFTKKEQILTSYSKEEMLRIKDEIKEIIPSIELR